MAFTQTDLDAIDKAIARGEMIVKHGEKLIRYQSADDMLARRAQIQRELDAAAAPNRPVPRHMLCDFSDD